MNIFEQVKIPNIPRSVFNLSHEKKLTADMGEIIPICCMETVPGDIFELGVSLAMRLQPLVAPIMHEVTAHVTFWAVQNRVMMPEPNGWETFITGGPNGTLTPTLPTWNPTNTAIGSLWDYLGLPTGVTPTGALPVDFIRRAYNQIYNQYFRDNNIITTPVAETNETILKAAWMPDYFTKALPWQQRGTTPAIPITGTANAQWTAAINLAWPAVDGVPASSNFQYRGATGNPYDAGTKSALEKGAVPQASLNANTINWGSAITFTPTDLRFAFQQQKIMERSAQTGARYAEWILGNFGEHLRDERAQRPEFIGGFSTPVIFSEVLQTSKTEAGAPQGNMAGHGIAVNNGYVGKYRSREFGIIMGLLVVRPKTAYQQGISRSWLKTTRYDYYNPLFAHLSEQIVTQAEVYANGVAGDNNTIFGYQGRWNELRYIPDRVAGDMRSTFSYWHMGRIFGAAPALNQTFIECTPDKRNFAVQNIDELIINVGNHVKAVRPLPISAIPGFIDH